MIATTRRLGITLPILLLTSHVLGQENVRSQPYVWKNVTVGAGGFIPGIVFSRVEQGLVYLRSDMGGCYRWEQSQQRWMPLQDDMGESSYFGGESIAPDPIDANVVYIAAGMYRGDPSAILRSRDRGRTWDVFPVSFRMGGNEDGRGVGERLAIDPNDHRILHFGSRHDGLMRSEDFGQTWKLVESFPVRGRGLPARGRPTNVGLSFVVFDPTTGTRGSVTKTIFVGSADPGEQHLFRSDDGGQTWAAVPGQPRQELLPLKAEIDERGQLYVTYSNHAGPNGATDGAVMKFNARSGQWTDITPDKRADRPRGGYCGISIDRKQPDTIAVTTLNRWGPVDTVWRSTDGGATWNDIVGRSQRDVRATPFLLWGEPQAKLGWWMAAFAVDPFDSNHAVYATGATVYATNDFSKVSQGEATHWSPWVEGIEQTAILTLCSPGEGAHLLSGFGDIGGFVHHDLDVSPPKGMYLNPLFGNTETIDYAANKPSVVVRSGRPHEGQAAMAYSEDGGETWQPLQLPGSGAADSARRREGRAIIVSADGSTFMAMTRPAMFTRDRGKTWTAARGSPQDARPVADRVDENTFYALDFSTRRIYISSDGGATFDETHTAGLPSSLDADRPTSSEAAWPLYATPTKRGDLWFVSKGGLFHSTDAGRTFAKVDGGVKIDVLSFGKAPPTSDYPALFAIGARGDLKAIWRSNDIGKSWIRVNDDRHEYGTRFRCLSGDPRIHGRVYVGTDGRGIVYGDIAK